MDKIDKLDIKIFGLSIDFKSLDKRFERFEKRMEKRFDKVMTVLDSIAGQFKKFDEERIILAGRQRNHEDRIEKLEKSVFGAS